MPENGTHKKVILPIKRAACSSVAISASLNWTFCMGKTRRGNGKQISITKGTEEQNTITNRHRLKKHRHRQRSRHSYRNTHTHKQRDREREKYTYRHRHMNRDTTTTTTQTTKKCAQLCTCARESERVSGGVRGAGRGCGGGVSYLEVSQCLAKLLALLHISQCVFQAGLSGSDAASSCSTEKKKDRRWTGWISNKGGAT